MDADLKAYLDGMFLALTDRIARIDGLSEDMRQRSRVLTERVAELAA